MTNTTKLQLPLIDANQSQKHVTHNNALLYMDILVELNVKNQTTNAPPGSPADGDTYIIGGAPTGLWAGKALNVTSWTNGAWKFFAPAAGWSAWDVALSKVFIYNGSSWVNFATAHGLQSVSGLSDGSIAQLGVNTSSDATNKFAVASSAILLTNIGNGIQVKLNKNAVGDTASFLFQTGFSGRAEIGTIGIDDFLFKVSPDGSNFFSGIRMHSALHGRTTVKDSFRKWRNELIAQPGVAAVSLLGLAVSTDGTLNLVAPSASNYFTQAPRVKYTSAAGAGSSCGVRGTVQSLWRGNGSGQGGFYAVFRGGIETFQTGARSFMGLVAQTASIGNVNPSTLLNMVGVGCDASGTTLQVFTNDGAGTATAVNLGASFPTNSGQSMYELILSCEPNGSDIKYRVENLNSGVVALGTISADLPTSTSFLAPHFWFNNNATAAAVEFAVAGYYAESAAALGSAGSIIT